MICLKYVLLSITIALLKVRIFFFLNKSFFFFIYKIGKCLIEVSGQVNLQTILRIERRLRHLNRTTLYTYILYINQKQ